jgi:hypothetical protein
LLPGAGLTCPQRDHLRHDSAGAVGLDCRTDVPRRFAA